jgi:hypothetical protein
MLNSSRKQIELDLRWVRGPTPLSRLDSEARTEQSPWRCVRKVRLGCHFYTTSQKFLFMGFKLVVSLNQEF